MIIQNSCAFDIPKEWDTESSNTTVYHNYNVQEVTPEATEEEPNPQKYYTYTQELYTWQEYAKQILAENQKSITALQLAAVEMYESLNPDEEGTTNG